MSGRKDRWGKLTFSRLKVSERRMNDLWLCLTVRDFCDHAPGVMRHFRHKSGPGKII
jgi:hypothetical protein